MHVSHFQSNTITKHPVSQHFQTGKKYLELLPCRKHTERLLPQYSNTLPPKAIVWETSKVHFSAAFFLAISTLFLPSLTVQVDSHHSFLLGGEFLSMWMLLARIFQELDLSDLSFSN